jgi:hypothetical protein
LNPSNPKHPSIAHKKIRQRANSNADHIGHHWPEMSSSHQYPHQEQIATDRDCSGRQIKSAQSAERFGRVSISPREPLMPEKVMQHCCLDGKRSREQIASPEPGQNPESNQLHRDTSRSHQIKLQPSDETLPSQVIAHEIRSSR